MAPDIRKCIFVSLLATLHLVLKDTAENLMQRCCMHTRKVARQDSAG